MPELIAMFIPILALSIPIIAIWTRHQRALAEIQARGRDNQAMQSQAHTAELEDRLRVLERIITDKGYDVATQIEALRDTRRSDARIEDKVG
ncbi:MAG: hypothetical protein ABI673_11350 [Novosphingobium sp.]